MYIVVLKKDNGERHKHSDMTTNYTFFILFRSDKTHFSFSLQAKRALSI